MAETSDEKPAAKPAGKPRTAQLKLAPKKGKPAAAAKPKIKTTLKPPAKPMPEPVEKPVAPPRPEVKFNTPKTTPKAVAPAPPAEPAPPVPPLRKGGAEPGGMREQEALRIFAFAAEQHRQGRLDDAVRGYGRALMLNPRIADAYNNLGVALRAQGKYAASVASYRRSLALKPGNPGVYSNMGNALRELGRVEESRVAHERAVAMAPESAEAVYNLGLVFRDLNDLEQAIGCFDRAIKLRPDHVEAHWDRALILLHMGRLEDGFREYEWRWRLDQSQPRNFEQPQWDGSDLTGRTILVHQEQGFGDMIQFARYLPQLKEKGATVVVECQAELARLFTMMGAVDKVVIQGGAEPAFDTYLPMLSLPRVLGTTLDTVPARVPYLTPPEIHGLHLAAPAGHLKVGISWAGKPSHRNDRNRSVGLDRFIDLAGEAGMSFFSLQKGPSAEQLTELSCDALIEDVSLKVQDFADTAVVLSQLDLVITVDTAIAHLAGAMGRQVWVALPFAPDWRWMQDRDDSPWYPTMRLVRQQRPGDWDGVFNRLRLMLEEVSRSRQPAAGAT